MSTLTANACSAAVEGPGLCRNGFTQNGACRGSACFLCHRPSDSVPMCMRDDFPDKAFKAWFKDDGAPRYAQASAQGEGDRA